MTEPKLLTVRPVAAEFQVTAQTIRNWIDHGTLPAVRVGRAFRVKRQDVEALLERASADSTSLATRRDLWQPTTTTLPRRHAADQPGSIWDDTSDLATPQQAGAQRQTPVDSSSPGSTPIR
jgi:excisionase family DNA binding protein